MSRALCHLAQEHSSPGRRFLLWSATFGESSPLPLGQGSRGMGLVSPHILSPVLLSVQGCGTGNLQLVLLVLLFDFLQDVDFQPGSLSVFPNVLYDFQCHL